MRLPYTYDWKDENGNLIAPDIECEVEVEVEMFGSEPEIEVTDVYVGDAALIRSKSPHVRTLGTEIAQAAERDDDIQEEALKRSGIVWSGRGANDPDGQWRRAS